MQRLDHGGRGSRSGRGDGWRRTRRSSWRRRQQWYSEPSAHRYGDLARLLLQLNVELEDGSTVAVTSDLEWHTTRVS